MFLPKPVDPPLPWPMYVKLPKNKGLDVVLLKENYLKEVYHFENYVNYINWLSTHQPKGPLPTEAGAFSSGYWDDNGNWIDTQNWVD
jgi:hypothetical protein